MTTDKDDDAMTSHPRDPRLRRQAFHPIDPAAAAVRLQLGADAMRAALTGPEPEPAELLAADVVTAVQLGTVAPPLTAQEFAAALADHDDEPALACRLAESPTPPVVVAVPPSLLPAAPLIDPPTPMQSAIAEVVRRERSEMNARREGWRSRHDLRSLAYGIRPTLAGSAPMTDRLWPTGPVLDQGAEGACVGFAVTDAVNAMRMGGLFGGRFPLAGDDDAERLYHRAQELDDVPGEEYSGTSVLAGMKAGVEAGLFGGYRWAFGTSDIAQAVLQVGPVVIGVPWLSGMYDTGPGGLVTLAGDDTGQGHSLAVVGLRRMGPQEQPGPYFVWLNSWGPSYGDGGLGYIHHRDLASLLHGVGEAAVPLAEPQHV